MSRAFSNVAVNADSFYSWLGKTNDMLGAFAETVTVKANTAGDMTSGNGFVTGVFGANTLTASILKGGNVQSNSTLLITSNVELGNSSFEVNTLQANVSQIKSALHTTSNTDVQIVDSFAGTTYRSGKYLISITAGIAYQSTEIMILHDGTNAYITEYATLLSGSTLGTFVANVDSGTIRLFVTPTNATSNVKYQRTLLTV
jgi:hypothetical protein